MLVRGLRRIPDPANHLQQAHVSADVQPGVPKMALLSTTLNGDIHRFQAAE